VEKAKKLRELAEFDAQLQCAELHLLVIAANEKAALEAGPGQGQQREKTACAQAGGLDDETFGLMSEYDAEGDEVCAPGNRSSFDLASDHPRPSAGAAAVRQAPIAGRPQRKKKGRGRPLHPVQSNGSS
jgi:hypothetical protein